MSPLRYRLIIEGELRRRYASAFDAMTVSTRNGTTEITGPTTDPSHRQALLEWIAGPGPSVHSSGHSHPRKASPRPSRTTAGADQTAAGPALIRGGGDSLGDAVADVWKLLRELLKTSLSIPTCLEAS
jgi:hypothetical protein